MDLAELTRIYADQLEQLLPPGLLFRRPTGTNLRALLEGLAGEFARAHGRVDQLLLEQAPRTTNELLGDWERVLGLPDPCAVVPCCIDFRRAAVVARIATPGGSSLAVFQTLALTLGYPITIEEHPVFRVGSRVGDRVYGVAGGWPWAFTVHAPVVTSRFFYAGQSGAGDALATFGNEPLECTFARVKPAHSHVLFAYDQAPHPASYQPWGWYVFPAAIALEIHVPPYSVST